MINDDDFLDISELDDLEGLTLDLGDNEIINLSPKKKNKKLSKKKSSKSDLLLNKAKSLPGPMRKRKKYPSRRTPSKKGSKNFSKEELKRIVDETTKKTNSLLKQQKNQNQQIKQKLSKFVASPEKMNKTKGNVTNEISNIDIESEIVKLLKEKPKQYVKHTNIQMNKDNKNSNTFVSDPLRPYPPLKKPRDFQTTDIERCLEILRAGEILPLHTIKFVCSKLSELLMKESNVRNISSPVSVVGDVHGQFYDVLEMFKIGGEPPMTNYLFLGDYVDRGHYSVETFSFLACLKMRHPDRVTLIRGNHESRMTTTSYGFMIECQEKYGTLDAWKAFTNMFDYLPVAATIDGEIFATHGGLSPTLHTIDAVRVIFRFREIPEAGPFCDLMWADPDPDNLGFHLSTRLASYTFGKDVFDKFMHLNKLSYMIRAHQLCQKGYQILWDNFATVWSAPNYYYRCGNLASICQISDGCWTKNFNVYDACPESERGDRTGPRKAPRVTHFDM